MIEDDLFKNKKELLKSNDNNYDDEDIQLILNGSYKDYLNDFYEKLNELLIIT